MASGPFRMQSNNPVFSNAQPLKQRPGTSPADLQEMWDRPQRLTLDDITVKTGLLLAIIVVTGALAWGFDVSPAVVGVAGLVGFVLAMVNIFKRQVVPALVVAYAAFEGVFVGGISHAYEGAYRGIVVQAVVGTAGVFGGVLLAYRSGKLRNTPTFRKVVVGGFVGLFLLLVVDAVVGLFAGGDPMGIRGGNLGLSILFSIAFIAFGALTFVLDFDQAERMVEAGVPERESWRIAFGLVVGLVWLYLEILRLLSYLNRR